MTPILPSAVPSLGAADRGDRYQVHLTSASLRPQAAIAVAAARALTGTAPTLLTGDNPVVAARLAAEVGITEVQAGLLPDDKVAAVRALQADGEKVVVVGDGINDAPALAAAHVGIAMGGAGSDLTLQTADAVVVRDDLTAIPAVIHLSRRARRVVMPTSPSPPRSSRSW